MSSTVLAGKTILLISNCNKKIDFAEIDDGRS